MRGGADGRTDGPVTVVHSARLAVLLALAVPTAASAQDAAIASDLWRVAAGTLVEPDAVASSGAAALWTPAVALNASGASLRVGIETIHTPSDIGVNGGIAAVAIRVGGLGTLNAVYARIGLDNLVRTETSPEGLEGSIPVYAQVLSVGGARGVTPALVVGAALRFESGRLADLERSQVGLDVGIVYTGITGFRLGATTRFWDPTLGASEQASGYAFGGQYRTADFPLWGTRGALVARYGVTLLHGESPQQLLAGGLVLGDAVELDVGAAHEETDAEAVWRGRFGLAVGAGRYRIVVARDAGVNDFGATYRFGLSAVLR